MEPPPPTASALSGATTVATAQQPPSATLYPPSHLGYADSIDSSPRSRNTDCWEDNMYSSLDGGQTSLKLRLMCSYNGHIVPRPHDKSLCYAGGETRIVVVDRRTTLSDLSHRLSKTLLDGRPLTLKYQLPSEDLDSLISVTSDEDLENMIEEYDRLSSNTTTATTTASTNKSSRIRLFLFPTKPDSASSIGSLLENSTKSEDWFLNVLNGTARGFSDASSMNGLLGLGLDDDADTLNHSISSEKEVGAPAELFGNVKGVSSNKQSAAQDVQSVPDSPMLETTSSFGSTSSSPSFANLPPIKVRMDDQRGVLGIEEQLSYMNVGAGGVNSNIQQQQLQRQEDKGVVLLPPSSTALTSVAPATVVASVPLGFGVEDYQNRVFSGDERSQQGMLPGYRRPPQSASAEFQQKPIGGTPDLPPLDSFPSEGSITNPSSRPKPATYQDSILQTPSGNTRVSVNPVDPKMSDPNNRLQMQQQLQDSGYLMPGQYDPQHASLLQQRQQQYIHSGTQYVPAGAMPMFYSVYPSQQQSHSHHPPLNQQLPVYYVPSGQAQGYNMPLQQSNYGEAAAMAPLNRPQTPPLTSMVPPAAACNPVTGAPPSKPDMASGIYRTASATAPPLVQVPSNQHQHQHQHHSQYVGFSQNLSSQPTTGNYAFDYADPSRAQFYFTQPLPPQLARQYHAMASAGGVVLPETNAQLPADNFKLQMRTTQP